MLLKPGLENFEHYFTSMWEDCNCGVVWVFFSIAFLWDWNENWPFPILWPLLSFPNLLAYWVKHFHSIIFRNWNSSAGILSPPLALFIVMLPKAHLTSQSMMSGSRWVITPSWLSWSWSSVLYCSPVYSCLLFLISSASVRSLPFLSFIKPIFAKNVPLISLIFLKRSLVFPILLFSSIFALIAEEGFLVSPCYSLELCIQMSISFLFFFAFHFPFFPSYLYGLLRQPFCFFCISLSWGWSWFLSPVQCHEPPSIVNKNSFVCI